MKHSPLRFEYFQITKYIYLGTNMCCQHDFAKALLQKGIRADISLEEKKVDFPFGVKYYLWLPTKDHQAPTLQQLMVGVHFLQDLKKQKIKCYVHCERGHGRAPTLLAAYLIATGMTVEQALSFIKRKRPDIHPNRRQLARLRQWKNKFTSRINCSCVPPSE